MTVDFKLRDTNPYQPTTDLTELRESTPIYSNAVLWRAYLLAPAVAPIVFVVLYLGLVIVGIAFGFLVGISSLLLVPIVTMTVGVLVSYGVAGVIGMPIAFFLRNRGVLNGYTIHAAALAWAIVFSLALAIFSKAIFLEKPNWRFPRLATYLVCGVTPPVLSSATAFWMLIRRGNMSQRTLDAINANG